MSRAANIIAGLNLLHGKGLIAGWTSMSPGKAGPWLVQVDDDTQHYLNTKEAQAFIHGALAAVTRLRA